jgi:hypothetical protein
MASSVHSISYCKIGVLWIRKELREESNESSLFGGFRDSLWSLGPVTTGLIIKLFVIFVYLLCLIIRERHNSIDWNNLKVFEVFYKNGLVEGGYFPKSVDIWTSRTLHFKTLERNQKQKFVALGVPRLPLVARTGYKRVRFIGRGRRPPLEICITTYAAKIERAWFSSGIAHCAFQVQWN